MTRDQVEICQRVRLKGSEFVLTVRRLDANWAELDLSNGNRTWVLIEELEPVEVAA